MINNDKSTANDLKIFWGKCAEIKAIEKANRVVNGKWYLAWDSGEIYIGNGLRKLTRFGGSNNSLTKDEIETMIRSLTGDELRAIRIQLSSYYKNYNDNKSAIASLQKYVEDNINELNTKTYNYIKNRIDDVIQNEGDISYSKQQIDDKIENTKNEIKNTYVTKEDNDNTLQNYPTYDYLKENQLAYATGEQLVSLNSLKTTGYYFCILDSSDVPVSFEKGHFYFLSNGNAEDIGAAGSGSSVSQSASLQLYFDNKTSDTIMIGESYSKSIHVTYDITGANSFVGALSLFQDGVAIKSNINVSTTSFYVNTTLGILDIGTKIFSLVGTDKKNNTIKSDFVLNIKGPIYYGFSDAAVPNENTIKSFTNKLQDVKGSYTISVDANKYIWLCVPSNEEITKITMNGFTAPFNEYVTQDITFNGIVNTYKCYRSTNALTSSTIVLDVE